VVHAQVEKGRDMKKPTTPTKAIRAKCIDCCCGSRHEVKLCTAVKCPLWEYRFGRRPETARAKYARYMDPETIEAVGRGEDQQDIDSDGSMASVATPSSDP